MSRALPPRSWIPNAATAANIAVGFASMLLTADGRYEAAVYLLVLAVILDMVDGKLARMLNATSEFGKQIDGYCDLLSFGAAPAFLVYESLLHQVGAVGVGVSLVYLLTGVYRLARFTLESDAHGKDTETTGLPIPVGAGYMMAFALMADRLDPWWVVALVLLLSAVMASRWSLPAFSSFGWNTVTILIGGVTFITFVIWPNWYTVVGWNLWNFVILAVARLGNRLERSRERVGP